MFWEFNNSNKLIDFCLHTTLHHSLFKTRCLCFHKHLNTTRPHIFSVFLYINKIVLYKDVSVLLTSTNSTRCLSTAVTDDLLLAVGRAHWLLTSGTFLADFSFHSLVQRLASQFVSRSSMSGVIKNLNDSSIVLHLPALVTPGGVLSMSLAQHLPTFRGSVYST